MASLAHRHTGAWRGRDPRQREHHAVIRGPEQFTRRLHAAGTFGKHDCQRFIDGALAELPRRHEAGKAEDVVGMPMRDRQNRGREHMGAERQLRAFSTIDSKLKGTMPEPIREHSSTETTHQLMHLRIKGAYSMGSR